MAAPGGSLALAPAFGEETLVIVEIDPTWAREERRDLDASGHDSRPDVIRLVVDRRRQVIVEESTLRP